MRVVGGKMTRRANTEGGYKWWFCEGRFKSQLLLDEGDQSPILGGLCIEAQHWLYLAQYYQSSFKSLVGTAYRVLEACRQRGGRRAIALRSAKRSLDDGKDQSNKPGFVNWECPKNGCPCCPHPCCPHPCCPGMKKKDVHGRPGYVKQQLSLTLKKESYWFYFSPKSFKKLFTKSNE